MDGGDKQQLLKEIRESEGRQAMASPLVGMMREWILCGAPHKIHNAQFLFMSLAGS